MQQLNAALRFDLALASQRITLGRCQEQPNLTGETMEHLTLEEKISHFHEFFSIEHPISVNAMQQPADFVLPASNALSDYMPEVFRVACDIANVEAQSLRSLRSLGDNLTELTEFLNHLSHKINVMMVHMLKREDDPQHQYQGVAFGGSGISIHSDTPFDIGTIWELKLFLESAASAVFCYGEVIQCQQLPESADEATAQYLISLIYSRIREQDQELLVRTSLHLQSHQLRQAAATVTD